MQTNNFLIYIYIFADVVANKFKFIADKKAEIVWGNKTVHKNKLCKMKKGRLHQLDERLCSKQPKGNCEFKIFSKFVHVSILHMIEQPLVQK